MALKLFGKTKAGKVVMADGTVGYYRRLLRPWASWAINYFPLLPNQLPCKRRRVVGFLLRQLPDFLTLES